jgi:hypothetical protein
MNPNNIEFAEAEMDEFNRTVRPAVIFSGAQFYLVIAALKHLKQIPDMPPECRTDGHMLGNELVKLIPEKFGVIRTALTEL